MNEKAENPAPATAGAMAAAQSSTASSSSTRDWGEGVLEHYFKMLSGFAHDQSKELVDREKNFQGHSSSVLPFPPSHVASCRVSFLNLLSQLALAEKAYHSMYFFVAKGFLRKDSSLRSSFEAIMTELVTLKETSKKLSKTGSVHLMCHICDQVTQYVIARMEMIDFYERLGSTKPDTSFVPWEDFLQDIKVISEKNHKLFHHPLLAPVKSAFDCECEAMVHLIEAQVRMEKYEFLPSLLCLSEASNKLNSWEALAHGCDEIRSAKLGLSSVISLAGRAPPERALLRWITSFKVSLVSKFTYYFYNVLSAQTSNMGEKLKSLSSNSSRQITDFYGKVVAFQRKTDALAVLLTFDAGELALHEGYKYPLRFPKKAHGLETVPAISCFPQKPVKHWPSIVMLVSGYPAESIEHPVAFFDEKIEATYFFMKVEPRMTFVVVFKSRRSERDSTVISFMMDVVSSLRSSKLLTSLCPRSK